MPVVIAPATANLEAHETQPEVVVPATATPATVEVPQRSDEAAVSLAPATTSSDETIKELEEKCAKITRAMIEIVVSYESGGSYHGFYF